MSDKLQSEFKTEEVFNTIRDILCDILVLNEEDVKMSSKLVDDLDADSIAFLELTFRIRSDFGLEVPDAKVDEETLTMPLLEGVEKIEQTLGGTTLFEYMKQEATLLGDQASMGLAPILDSSQYARDRAKTLTLGELAQLMGTSLPQDFTAEDLISALELRDLFRFITVESYVKYVQSLAKSQNLIRSLGGAEKMDMETAAKLREDRASH